MCKLCYEAADRHFPNATKEEKGSLIWELSMAHCEEPPDVDACFRQLAFILDCLDGENKVARLVEGLNRYIDEQVKNQGATVTP